MSNYLKFVYDGGVRKWMCDYPMCGYQSQKSHVERHIKSTHCNTIILSPNQKAHLRARKRKNKGYIPNSVAATTNCNNNNPNAMVLTPVIDRTIDQPTTGSTGPQKKRQSMRNTLPIPFDLGETDERKYEMKYDSPLMTAVPPPYQSSDMQRMMDRIAKSTARDSRRAGMHACQKCSRRFRFRNPLQQYCTDCRLGGSMNTADVPSRVRAAALRNEEKSISEKEKKKRKW